MKNFYELFKMFCKIAGAHKKEYLKSLFSGIVAIFICGLIYASFYFLFLNLTGEISSASINSGANLGEISGANANFGANSSPNLAPNKSGVYIWLGVIFALSVAFFALKFKSTYYDNGGTFISVGRDLREKLGRKLASVPLCTIHRYKTGDLNAVFSSNVGEAVMFMNMIPLMALDLVIIAVIATAATFAMSAKLGLLMLIMLPIAVPLYRLRRKLAIEEKSEFVAANADLESAITEYIQGIGVLRALNQTGQNAQNLQEKIENVRQIQLKAMKLAGAPTLAMGSIATLLMCACLFLGAYLQLSGEISVAIIAGALVILSRLTEPFSIFLSVASIFDLIDAGFSRVKEILSLKDLQILEPNLTPRDFGVEFENVSFAYENLGANLSDSSAEFSAKFGDSSLENSANFALKNVSFKVRPKSLTAFVGTSGSGKSTATKLLMRYADPQMGAVKIGGADVKNMSQEKLLSNLSFVFQDVYLFNDTILNNIKFARKDASDDEVRKVAKMAHLDEFISRLPLGFDTLVGDIGANFSGGEKSRIAIARAILKNAPIVVLDEPTAALDSTSEFAVQKAIDALAMDKTLIIIAHRLSTVVGADEILVFENGEIIERGTHSELLAHAGKYSKMWAAQNASKEWRAQNR